MGDTVVSWKVCEGDGFVGMPFLLGFGYGLPFCLIVFCLVSSLV